MNYIIIHSTSLSQKAHWVQIINTAHALSELPDATVWVLPRTFEPGGEVQLLRDMGFEPKPNIHFIPTVSKTWYNRLKLHGDMLSMSQGKIGRMLARRTITRLIETVSAKGPAVVLTRNEDLLLACGDLLRANDWVILNELHKFEYVKILEGKLGKKRAGRQTLSQFKQFARTERNAELAKLSMFDGVICTTPSIESRLRDFGITRPTLVIPNGANTRAFAVSDRPPAKDIDILYVGQLYRWKNVDLLIEALVHLPDKTLTVVGGDQPEDTARLRNLAVRLGVANRVELLGHQPHASIKGFMQRAKVGVVPLPRRGFAEARLFCCPLKALEMMAASTPIVATRLRSVEGLLINEQNALLVPPDDAKAMADGIRRVLEDESLRGKLVAGGLETAAELSYEERAKKIAAFAEQLRGN